MVTAMHGRGNATGVAFLPRPLVPLPLTLAFQASHSVFSVSWILGPLPNSFVIGLDIRPGWNDRDEHDAPQGCTGFAIVVTA